MKSLSEASIDQGMAFEQNRWAPAYALAQTDDHLQRMKFSLGSEEKRTVQAGRRRRTSEPGPEGRERAEAPQRRRPGQGAGSSTGGGGGGGLGIPGFPSSGGPRMSLIGIIIVILLAICGVPVMMLQNSGDTGDTSQTMPTYEEQAQVQPTEALPTPRPKPTKTQAASAAGSSAVKGGQTWLVMLYQDADDKILEQDIYVDLNEAETGRLHRPGADRGPDRPLPGGFQGDGDWIKRPALLRHPG